MLLQSYERKHNLAFIPILPASTCRCQMIFKKIPNHRLSYLSGEEFNSRTLLSPLHTKECYSGKGGAVAFFSWKDITKQPSGAPSHRPWVWVGQGGFLSLLLALGHGWDRQGAEKVKFLSAAWLLFPRLQPWSGSSPVCLWFSNCVRPGTEAQSRTEMSCSDQGPGCLSGVETLQNR